MSECDNDSRQELRTAVDNLSKVFTEMSAFGDADFKLKWDKNLIRRYKRECLSEAERIEALPIGDASKVLPSMLRCVARHLDLSLHHELPVEVQALACRTIFELWQRAKLMADDPALISKFLANRWFDEKQALEAMFKFQPAPWLRTRIEYVENRIASQGFTKHHGDSARQRAESLGMTDEHNAYYGLMSLYCHATGMLAADEYQTSYQLGWIYHAHHYASEFIFAIQRCVRRLQKQQ